MPRRERKGRQMKATVCLAVPLVGCLLASAAKAEIFDYDCAVGVVQILIHVDTQALIVTETAQKDGLTEVGRYSDGVFGPVGNAGAASTIPPVHQFVRIDDQKIYFGAELGGREEGAVLDRQLATLTIPSRKSGWCSRILSSAK
jgi:membrane-associated protease RseP (regulator of RpoE activity)